MTESNLPALAGLSDEVRADLLRAQRESVTTPQQLPKIKLMPGGVGLFEHSDTNVTSPTITGVILNHHPRNVLWDKAFDDDKSDVAAENLPACSSNDGKFGVPRENFAHAGLPNGELGDGIKRVECRICPYNQWGSGQMLSARGNPKGKAVTNQRSVYLIVESHESPYELVLPPTSLAALDEYITSLTNRGVPIQAVVTEIRQIVKGRPDNARVRWGVAQFKELGPLDNDAFVKVMQKRTEYSTTINPPPVVATVVAEPGIDMDDADDDLPF